MHAFYMRCYPGATALLGPTIAAVLHAVPQRSRTGTICVSIVERDAYARKRCLVELQTDDSSHPVKVHVVSQQGGTPSPSDRRDHALQQSTG